jgi:hypothetical protein
LALSCPAWREHASSSTRFFPRVMAEKHKS